MSSSQLRLPDLSDEQAAVYAAMCEFARDPPKLTLCIHGLAGTGKTTLLAHFARNNKFAALCTPTGKAASILRRKTGLPACTIHSYFYRLIEVTRDKRGRKDLRFEEVYQPDTLSNRIVLLDECGMVGDKIVHDILATGAIIIATGDPGQLQPVKQNPYFVEPDLMLETIHRQALDSPIIRQAHRVREGFSYETDGEEFLVKHHAFDDDIRNAEIALCWTNKTKSYLNLRSRALRGHWQSSPQPGEPLMCLTNDNINGIYNGAIYELVEPWRDKDASICIDVDGHRTNILGARFTGKPNPQADDDRESRTFTWGYACTVHKAAGSEWDNVLLLDEYRREDERNRWLYTGITRAKDSITVVT